MKSSTIFSLKRMKMFLHPFYSFEFFLRQLTLLFDRTYNKYGTFFSLIYCYCVLQLVGIVWAFMTNLAVALGLRVATEISTSAIEFAETSSTGESSSWRKREICATVYVVYATFRCCFKFMQKSVSTITQSVNDFPHARTKIIKLGNSSAGSNLFIILLGTFLPNLVISISLIFTKHLDCSVEPQETKTLRDRICFDLPFQYISKSYDLPRKILTITLILSLIQYAIVLLNQFPSWSKAFSSRAKLFFDVYIYCLTVATALFLLKVALRFYDMYFVKMFNVLEFCGVDEIGLRERLFAFGGGAIGEVEIKHWLERVAPNHQVVLFCWLLGLFFCGWACLTYSKPILNDAGKLKQCFSHLKNSFIVYVFVVFLVEMINPNVGFINAQIDLTLLTIAIPAFHVTLTMSVESALNSNMRIVYYCPLAMSFAAACCHFSRAKGVGSFFVVTMHVMLKFIQLFGAPSVSAKKSDEAEEEANSDSDEEEDDNEDATADEVERKRNFTLMGVDVMTKKDENKNKNKNKNKKKKLPVDLKKSIIKKYKEKQEKNNKAAPKFVFAFMAKFGFSFAVVMSLIVALIAVTAFLQTKREWYPELIELNNAADEKKIRLNHAHIAKLELETDYENFTPERLTLPKYATCGAEWNGLSLLDLAILSEIAYFDPKNHNLDEIVDIMFTPQSTVATSGARKTSRKLFEVQIPPPEMRKTGIAQFFDAYSDDLNVSIIAIRGTDVGRLSDIIEDVKIFKEPVLLSMLSMIFPTIRFWPESVSAIVIHCLSQMLQVFGLESNAEYYKGILDYVRKLKGKNDRDIILTGHSLGGGLARIVGSIEQVPSVVFSPPGFRKSFYKFLFNEMRLDDDLQESASLLHHMSAAVLPESDPVTAVDTQVGMVQMIKCDVVETAMQNSCHMLEGTICSLLNSCGDEKRKRFKTCDFKFGLGGAVRESVKVVTSDKYSMLGISGVVVVVLLIMFVSPL